MRITQSLLLWKSFHGKNIQSHLRFRAWTFLPSAAAILTLLLLRASSFAGSATWQASPASGDWNTAGNWTAGGPPNGSSDTATFATSNTTGLSVSASTEVNGIVFNAGASAFTFTIPNASSALVLTISGVGITNNSGITQNFPTPGEVGGSNGSNGGIQFINSATAGSLTAFTNNAGGVNGSSAGGSTFFNSTSTAGSATITNNGGVFSAPASGGETDSSSRKWH